MNKVALILSFIFSGFGQIWNREYTQGITFIILRPNCVSLVVLFIMAILLLF